MSQIDDFMSKIIEMSEIEKDETILFLATALECGDPHIVKNISRKVTYIVMPFLMNVMLEKLKRLENKEMKGGEKVGSIGSGKESKEV